MRSKYKFCPYCAKELGLDRTHGLAVKYCNTCKKHFFNNPAPGVAVLAEKGGKILLVKRKLPPMAGTWALPGGFMEQGESFESAGLRELKEETGLKAKKARFFHAMTLQTSFFGTVVVAAVAVDGLSGRLKAGDDAMEAEFFDPKKLPLIAFRGHRVFIKDYVKSKVISNKSEV